MTIRYRRAKFSELRYNEVPSKYIPDVGWIVYLSIGVKKEDDRYVRVVRSMFNKHLISVLISAVVFTIKHNKGRKLWGS